MSHLRPPPLASAVTALVLVLALGRAAPAAPPDWEARAAALRAELVKTPDDTGKRCELGFALVNLERWADARGELDVAVAALGSPSDPKLARRLGACLYNRGLAARGAGDVAAARADFTRSLAVRPNDTVAAALEALGATTTPDATLRAAVADACIAMHGTGDTRACRVDDATVARVPAPPACARSGEWAMVTFDSSYYPERWAVRAHGGTIHATRVVERFDWGLAGVPTHTAEVALVPIDRGLCALVDDETEAGTFTCDIDARPDAHDHRDIRRTRRFVVAGDDAGLATVLEVPLAVHDCEHRYTTEVTFDGRGHARVTASEGTPPREVLGRHDLTE